MHQIVIKVSHTFIWDRNYSDENGIDYKDESENIDTSHSKIQIPCRMTRKIKKKPSQCRNESSLESKVKDLGSTV